MIGHIVPIQRINHKQIVTQYVEFTLRNSKKDLTNFSLSLWQNE